MRHLNKGKCKACKLFLFENGHWMIMPSKRQNEIQNLTKVGYSDILAQNSQDWSDFSPKIPKKSNILGQISMRPVQYFALTKCIYENWRFAPQTSSLNLVRDVVCLFGTFSFWCVLEVFEKCTKDSSRERAHRTPRMFWSDFGSKMVRFWSDFQGKWVRQSVRF